MPVVSRKQYAELCGDDILKINMWIKRGKISVSAVNKKLIDTENAINATFMSDRRRINSMLPFDGTVPENDTITTKKEKSTPKIGRGYKTLGKLPVEKTKTVTNIPKSVTKSGSKAPGTSKNGTKTKTAVQKSSAGRPPKAPLNPIERQPKSVPTAQPREIKQFDKRIVEQSARDERRVDQDIVKKGLEIENLELAKQQKLLQLNKSAGNLLPVDLVKGVLKRHGDTFFKNFEKAMERFISIISGSDQETYVKHLASVKEMLSTTIRDAGKQADAEILILVNDYSETLARGQKKI